MGALPDLSQHPVVFRPSLVVVCGQKKVFPLPGLVLKLPLDGLHLLAQSSFLLFQLFQRQGRG